MTMECIFAG